jgi:hypothetical protein
MKTYEELTPDDQKKVYERAFNALLTSICNGEIRFNDTLNQDDMQARIDRAFAKAEEMQTPWFAHEYMLKDEVLKDFMEGMARVDAEDGYYDRVPAGLIVYVPEYVR